MVVIRHASGLSAELGIVGGHLGCRGLSKKGRLEAISRAERLQAMGIRLDVLGQSNILRSQETAEVIAPYLSARLLEATCDLCELHPGPYDGLPVRSLPTSIDPYLDPSAPYLPGAETVSELNFRVESYLGELVDYSMDHGVGVVVHLGVIRAIAEMTIGVDPDTLVKYSHPASAWIFKLSKSKGGRPYLQLQGASR